VTTQALYNRWRGQAFDDILGQEHITRTLQNQIRAGRIGHAYLFTGLRGTGKTSTARILAKAVNCTGDSDHPPCNACPTCVHITEGRSLDLIEIDAASNTSVEDVRDLRDKINFSPTDGKYKVYIIDEVHMLSTAAFNALLKTLEEPPEHIIFIFATTEPQKILPTILSRCQRFDFARLTQQTIADTLRSSIAQLGISAEDSALFLIAANSDGAMRDAFSFADKAINLSDGKLLTLSDVQNALGLADGADLYRMAEALVHEDVASVFELLNSIIAKGSDISQITNQLIEYFRGLMIYCNTPNPAAILGANEPLLQSLEQCGKNIPADLLVSYVSVLSRIKTDARYLPHPRYLLESALLSLSDRNQMLDRISLTARVDRLERQIEQLKTLGTRPKLAAETTEAVAAEQQNEPQQIKSTSPKANRELEKSEPEPPKQDKELIAKAQSAVEFAAKFIHNRDRDILLSDIFKGLKVEAYDGSTIWLYPSGTAVHMMDIFHAKEGESKLKPILHDQLGAPVELIISDQPRKKKETKKDAIEKAKEIFGNLEEID